MIRVPKKDWFYSCYLFLLSVLLAVGCTGINSGSREVASNRPTTPSSEITTALKRIKGLLPNGTVVAHKTGTSSTVNGVTAATNDVGLVTLPNGQHLAIAVFVSDSQATDVIREEVIAKVARAAWDEWVR